MSDRFSNFHTHTCLCDGKDTPEELVLRALELGCPALGFSGHSYAPYDEGYCMSVAQTAEYKAEIRRLQQKYTGRICIYMGIEQDFYSEAFTEEYDYVIGSVHYLRKNGAYLPVDASEAQQAQAVQDYYGGDWYAFAEDYYRTVAQVRERTGCRIVGHFDLVTKFNEGDCSPPATPAIFGRFGRRWMRWRRRTLRLRSTPAPWLGATARSRTPPARSWRSCAAGV